MAEPDKRSATIVTSNLSSRVIEEDGGTQKRSLRRRIREIVWDTLDRSPEERRFISKIDFFILTWAGFSYFSKNLNSNNLCRCIQVLATWTVCCLPPGINNV